MFKSKPLVAAVAVAIPLSFIASDLSAAVLEEVMVTAQKREQSIQDVGIAITAYTGDQLSQLGWTNAQQVTAMAPGVTTVQPNGEANYGWAVLPWPYGGDGWGFYTADHGNQAVRPQLRVYYTPTRPVMISAEVTGVPPSSVTVLFEGEPGKTYEVWRSPAVAGAGVNWTKVGEATATVSGVATFVDPAPLANSAYYRARTK